MTFGPALSASQGLVPTPLFVLDTHGCAHLGLHHSDLSLPPGEDYEFINVLRSCLFPGTWTLLHTDLEAGWLA